jgi:Fe-S cluster assembly iron-binding protein IscA
MDRLVETRSETTTTKARRVMLELTDQARDAIKGIIDDAEVGPDGGLRISGTPNGNGEAGLEFSVAGAAEAGDETVSSDGANVFLDAAAAEELADKKLDVEAHGDHFHFSLEEQDGAAA